MHIVSAEYPRRKPVHIWIIGNPLNYKRLQPQSRLFKNIIPSISTFEAPTKSRVSHIRVAISEKMGGEFTKLSVKLAIHSSPFIRSFLNSIQQISQHPCLFRF